ncbi:hypothetical protein J6590_083936 [Homalodisca vitripennis]|nr:hypothetical protein J6590_083936 [Homalodisca vitripennis]
MIPIWTTYSISTQHWKVVMIKSRKVTESLEDSNVSNDNGGDEVEQIQPGLQETEEVVGLNRKCKNPASSVLATCRDMLSSCSPPDLAVAVQSQLSPGLCLLVTHSASLRKMESKESASFKYDVVSLIELVESHPCLWDKTNKDNKNKIIREKSWKEIFQFLEDGCDVLNIEEKKKVGKLV